MKILITSGGTQIPIDSVRHIGNMSSGRAGSELATAFLKKGYEVYYFHSGNSHTPISMKVDLSKVGDFDYLHNIMIKHNELKPYLGKYHEKEYLTYDDYSNGVVEYIKEVKPDVIVASAAVSDYGVEKHEGKISSANGMSLNFIPLDKVLPKMKAAYPYAKLIGFKLLVNSTPEELKTAAMKTMACGCYKVAANDLSNIKNGVRNYTVFDRNGEFTFINNYNFTFINNYNMYNELVTEFLS